MELIPGVEVQAEGQSRMVVVLPNQWVRRPERAGGGTACPIEWGLGQFVLPFDTSTMVTRGHQISADIEPQFGKNLKGLLMSWGRHISARVYIAGMAIAAFGCFAFAFLHWQSTDPVK